MADSNKTADEGNKLENDMKHSNIGLSLDFLRGDL